MKSGRWLLHSVLNTRPVRCRTVIVVKKGSHRRSGPGKKQARIDLVTRYANVEPNSLSISRASSMKELPSFIKPKMNDKDMLRTPFQYHPSLMVLDTAYIQALMSTPIKVTLTLAKILKVKQKFWHETRVVPITKVGD